MSGACVITVAEPGGGIIKAVVTATSHDSDEGERLRKCFQDLCLSQQYGCRAEGQTVSVTCPPQEADHIRDMMALRAEGEGFEVRIN